MTTNLDILNILYDKKISKKSVTLISKEYNVARGTVYNLCNRYNLRKDEILKFKKDVDEGRISEISLNKYFDNSRKKKVTETDISVIKTFCKKYLNCYLSPEKYCEKLCELKDIHIEHIVNYGPNTDFRIAGVGEPFEYGKKREYRSKILYIRGKESPVKNFREVYDCYFLCDSTNNPRNLSWNTFYNYAKGYWDDKCTWGNLKLGEYIDKFLEVVDGKLQIKSNIDVDEFYNL